MATPRERLAEQVSRALGPRQVFWYGTRGDDGRALTDLGDQFSAVFSIVNRPRWLGPGRAASYEEIIGRRVDLDAWDIDDHLLDDATAEFRHAMLTAMAKDDHAIVAYRPSNFLSALEFARQDRGLSLGLFAGLQRVFEHKPWVESAVRSMGVPMVPWSYIADEEQLDARFLLADGPVVVRPSRGSGGSGMACVDDATALDAKWPHGEEFFASVSPYLPQCLPLNIGAVAWDDGVTVHHPSAQLIGIPSCVGRPFGYCGNDFALVKSLDPGVIDTMERVTRLVGDWMRGYGFRGAFGVDFMVHDGVPLFTEVNPRFQGSTRMSAQLSRDTQTPCILLDHMAAMLHLPCPYDRPSLRQIVADTPDRSQVIIHNTSGHPVRANAWKLTVAVRDIPAFRAVELDVDPEITCEPNSIIICATFDRSVTNTGHCLMEDVQSHLVTLDTSPRSTPTEGS